MTESNLHQSVQQWQIGNQPACRQVCEWLWQRLSAAAVRFVYELLDSSLEDQDRMQQAAVIHDHMIGQIFAVASDSQRSAYLKTVGGEFERFLSLVFQYLSSYTAAVRAALDLVLRRKAIGAEVLAAQRDAVLGGQYPPPRTATAATHDPTRADYSQTHEQPGA